MLAVCGVDSARHSGVISLFQRHFVKTNLIAAEVARGLPRAFEKRLNSDYADFSEVTSEDVTRVRTDVSRFIEACATLLERLLREGET